MKLSELVALSAKLNSIKSTVLDELLDEADENLREIQPLADKDSDSIAIGLLEILEDLAEFKQNIQNSVDKIDSLIKSVDKEIVDITKNWKTRNYYINGVIATNAVDIETDRNTRKTIIDDTTKQIISTAAEAYSSWQHAVLEIGPGDGLWTPHLVAGDPLYLIDVHEEYLKSTISKFHKNYQKRIRSYVVSQHYDSLNLSVLPQGQFGFIFAWNVFDYLPYQNISVYLNQCFKLLKPGGVMMFSYNDCEAPLSASYAEIGFKSWMPKWLLTEAIQLQGFEIIKFSNQTENHHWVEIKKPGELKSIRASQPLASILPDPNRRPVDIVPERTYNKQQSDRLKQIAIQMNLGSAEEIMRDKHTPHQLHVMIEKARNQK